MTYSVIGGKLKKHRKWKPWEVNQTQLRYCNEDWSKGSREMTRRMRKPK